MTKTYRVQEPLAPYVADEDRQVAKLFPNGRSQAVRLPKAFRLPGKEVWIHRDGRRLIIEPIGAEAEAGGWPEGHWARVDRLRDGLDLDSYRLPSDPPPPAASGWDGPD